MLWQNLPKKLKKLTKDEMKWKSRLKIEYSSSLFFRLTTSFTLLPTSLIADENILRSDSLNDTGDLMSIRSINFSPSTNGISVPFVQKKKNSLKQL